MAKVGGKEAQGPAKGVEVEVVAQTAPAGAQRSGGYGLTPLGWPVVPEVNRMRGVIVECREFRRGSGARMHSALVDFLGAKDPRTETRETGRKRAVGRFAPDRKARGGRSRQRFDLERRQAGIDGNGAAPKAPDCEQVREELERVAVMQKDSIEAAEAKVGIVRRPAQALVAHCPPVPCPAGQRLVQVSDAQVIEHGQGPEDRA